MVSNTELKSSSSGFYRSLGWKLLSNESSLTVSPMATGKVDMGLVQSAGFCEHISVPQEGTVRCVLVTQGEIEGTWSQGEVGIEPGSFVLFRSEEEVRGKCFGKTTRFAWQLPEVLFNSPLYKGLYGEPLRTDGEMWAGFIGMCNSILRHPRQRNVRVEEDLATAIAFHLRALVGQYRQADSVSLAQRRLKTLQHAEETIAQSYTSAEFGVSELAKELHVSLPTLHRLFSFKGSTPYTEIRKARLERAKTLLGDWESATPDRADEVAALSGFRNRQAMKRSFRSAYSKGMAPEAKTQ